MGLYFSNLMESHAIEKGWKNIMNETWFCHKPNCGICPPCQYTIVEGMEKRLPFTSNKRYHLSLLYKIKNYIQKNFLKGYQTHNA